MLFTQLMYTEHETVVTGASRKYVMNQLWMHPKEEVQKHVLTSQAKGIKIQVSSNFNRCMSHVSLMK